MRCLHCGEATGPGQDFCCPGCEAAHATTATAQAGTGFSRLASESEDGGYTLTLGVEGIHCAACIRLIENALLAEDGVSHARVNMTTNRVSMAWQGMRDYGDHLANTVTKLGYRLHSLDKASDAVDNETRSLLRAIAVAGFAAGNMMLISVGLWSTDANTMGMATRDLFHWLSALIALPTVLYAGQPFFRSAIAVLRQGHTNMDVPISIAVTLACGMSLFEAFRHGQHVYFDSAVMLLFFLLIGRYLDARAKGKARQTASDLLSRLSGMAMVYDDGQAVQVPITELREGMLVMVAAGENIAADGMVEKGVSEADMSLITGETMPEKIGPGKAVFAGTLNLSTPIQVRVSKATEQSLLSEIVRLMEVNEQGGARYVRLADKAASLYTPVVHAMGALTFVGWWLFMQAPWQTSLLHAVTVLIITCPCALGLAVPVVQVLASSKLMKTGILLKSGDALEKLAEVTTVVFDKTGTLTVGCPELTGNGFLKSDLRLAASLAAHSRHPLSRALTAAYDGDLIEMNVSELPGCGLQAEFEGWDIRLGSRAWCGDQSAATSDHALELWLAIGDEVRARFAFSDRLRPDAAQVVTALKARYLDVRLLSGDRLAVVAAIAEEAGITAYRAEISPVEKCDYLRTLADGGAKVLMVGDGLNDAPALAAAHVSMSPSTAMDITQNTADVVFQGGRLSPVLEAFEVADVSMRLVRQNFGLAILYNLVAIPVAVLGYVTPLLAAVAMSGSSLVVILNAFRLNLGKGR
ncbi:heavy metal translocating P-type ATPase [Kordiimonas aestuarii]|uniref:heavy metal translocating P-type ATPase n=1 Tax=Kordiimonas aestuarii TaxID=1005925 RepID=UPI0021D0EB8E|nr:copper-translocating P-type ATPase [Kordiimonas aestuarii]